LNTNDSIELVVDVVEVLDVVVVFELSVESFLQECKTNGIIASTNEDTNSNFFKIHVNVGIIM
jgi:hypothetical protein